MKKFLVFLIVGLLASSAAWGATIAITANAASKLEVSVDSDTWTIALDNTGAAYEDAGQGALTVKSSKSAYTVSFASANNGTLVKGTDTIPYKVKVDTAGWSGVATNNLSAYTQLTAAATKTIVFSSRTPTAGKTFDIGFKIDAYSEYYVDGAYTDTITISIASN
jgi:hypothetical protein